MGDTNNKTGKQICVFVHIQININIPQYELICSQKETVLLTGGGHWAASPSEIPSLRCHEQGRGGVEETLRKPWGSSAGGGKEGVSAGRAGENSKHRNHRKWNRVGGRTTQEVP